MSTKEEEVDLAWFAHTKKRDSNVMTAASKKVVRKKLSETQNHRCCYCGCRFTESGPKKATIEHVLPKSLGGSNHVANLVVACLECNGKRGSVTTPEYFRLIYKEMVT